MTLLSPHKKMQRNIVSSHFFPVYPLFFTPCPHRRHRRRKRATYLSRRRTHSRREKKSSRLGCAPEEECQQGRERPAERGKQNYAEAGDDDDERGRRRSKHYELRSKRAVPMNRSTYVHTEGYMKGKGDVGPEY